MSVQVQLGSQPSTTSYSLQTAQVLKCSLGEYVLPLSKKLVYDNLFLQVLSQTNPLSAFTKDGTAAGLQEGFEPFVVRAVIETPHGTGVLAAEQLSPGLRGMQLSPQLNGAFLQLLDYLSLDQMDPTATELVQELTNETNLGAIQQLGEKDLKKVQKLLNKIRDRVDPNEAVSLEYYAQLSTALAEQPIGITYSSSYYRIKDVAGRDIELIDTENYITIQTETQAGHIVRATVSDDPKKLLAQSQSVKYNDDESAFQYHKSSTDKPSIGNQCFVVIGLNESEIKKYLVLQDIMDDKIVSETAIPLVEIVGQQEIQQLPFTLRIYSNVDKTIIPSQKPVQQKQKMMDSIQAESSVLGVENYTKPKQEKKQSEAAAAFKKKEPNKNDRDSSRRNDSQLPADTSALNVNSKTVVEKLRSEGADEEIIKQMSLLKNKIIEQQKTVRQQELQLKQLDDQNENLEDARELGVSKSELKFVEQFLGQKLFDSHQRAVYQLSKALNKQRLVEHLIQAVVELNRQETQGIQVNKVVEQNEERISKLETEVKEMVFKLAAVETPGVVTESTVNPANTLLYKLENDLRRLGLK